MQQADGILEASTRASLLWTTDLWPASPFPVSMSINAFLAIAIEGSSIVLSEEMAHTRCLGKRTGAGAIQCEHNAMSYD